MTYERDVYAVFDESGSVVDAWNDPDAARRSLGHGNAFYCRMVDARRLEAAELASEQYRFALMEARGVISKALLNEPPKV
jgi:hypothetical protein